MSDAFALSSQVLKMSVKSKNKTRIHRTLKLLKRRFKWHRQRCCFGNLNSFVLNQSERFTERSKIFQQMST